MPLEILDITVDCFALKLVLTLWVRNSTDSQNEMNPRARTKQRPHPSQHPGRVRHP